MVNFIASCLFFAGFKEQIFHEGDKLVVVHSHELHPPALPRKYSIVINSFFFYPLVECCLVLCSYVSLFIYCFLIFAVM